jgi:hypothetical protein
VRTLAQLWLTIGFTPSDHREIYSADMLEHHVPILSYGVPWSVRYRWMNENQPQREMMRNAVPAGCFLSA